jgi:molybdopterin-guanine dinucleotide biosynthesis protein A
MSISVQASGVIMAGGVSRRLGRDKALEVVGGKTLIGRVVDTLTPLTTEVVAVFNRREQAAAMSLPAHVRVVTDRYPGGGSLGGIFSGLCASSASWSLVVACDMPFLNPRLLRYLLTLAADVDAVVPRLGGRPEPLHGLYSKACVTPFERSLREGQLKIAPALEAMRVRYVEEADIEGVDPRHLSFFNINNEADLEEAAALLEEEKEESGRG